MTKAQRKARAKRAGAVRRKANAVKAFMRKMNPGKKAPVAVRVKRLKGGGISVTPLKANPQPKGHTAFLRRRGISKKAGLGSIKGAFKLASSARRGRFEKAPHYRNIAW